MNNSLDQHLLRVPGSARTFLRPALALLFPFAIALAVIPAQAQQISTVAGNGTPGYSGDGGLATNAEIYYPFGVAVDTGGNIYIADADNYAVRKITISTGIISTVAGNGTPGYSGDGGPATSAQVNPGGIAIDASGNLYISDVGDEVIRKVTASTGVITTIAGNGIFGYSGDGGPATSAEIGDPVGIAVDQSGNVYFADSYNNLVRRIDASTGIITSVAGTGTAGFSGDGGLATNAQISDPQGIAIDAAGNIYISDCRNQRIRVLNPSTGIISTVVGVGTAGTGGDGGPATSAQLYYAEGIAVDSQSNIYIADTGNGVIREVLASTGIISTIAGQIQVDGFSGDGGRATSAELDFPEAVAVDSSGNIDIADWGNFRIRQVAGGVTGGSGPTPPVFDSGTVTLTINGVSDSVSYSGTLNSSANAIATGLAAAVNADPSSLVTINAVGTDLIITSKQTGASLSYPYSVSTAYDSQDFSQGSFSGAPSSGNLGDASTSFVPSALVYNYSIPSEGGYAPNSNIMAYTDSVTGQWSMSGGYDSLNRLVGAVQTPVGGSQQNYCWFYDSFGNRRTQAMSASPFSGSLGSECRTRATGTLTENAWVHYNANNQPTESSQSLAQDSLLPDASGNVPTDGQHQYLYDAEGRICAVGTAGFGAVGYLYNADGVRVAKGSLSIFSCDLSTNGFTVTNEYLQDADGGQLTEFDGQGTWIHTNVSGGGVSIASYDNDGLGVHFHLVDWLGTRRVQTDFAGNPELLCSGGAFGDLLQCSTPTGANSVEDATELHFTGKERDTESGNDYFGARYYGSTTGRFMSPDWSAKAEPVPYSRLDNPQTLNLYAYVGNNPLSRTDPTGHYVCSGSKDQCAAIQTGLNLAKAAQDKLGADSKGGKAIGKVLSFYGAAGEKNGVNVSFGKLEGGALGQASMGANGSVNLKFDLGAINESAKGSIPGTSITERAGAEIHEGQHGVDERVLGHNPENRHEELGTERNAYRTQSYVFQGLGVGTPSGLWSPSWSPATAEQNRNAGVEAGAQRSTNAVCAQGCEP